MKLLAISDTYIPTSYMQQGLASLAPLGVEVEVRHWGHATLIALQEANLAIEKGGPNVLLEDADTTAIIRKQVKQRQDSIESFTKGGRPELAAKEETEMAILREYLPKAMSPEELAALVKDAIAEAGASSKAQMGAVMKLASAKAAGRADGKALSLEVAKQLA